MNDFDVVELTQALVRVPSFSGDEEGVASLISERMKAFGFDVSVDSNGSVLGLIGPRNCDVALLFDGHLDVVPVTGAWTVDPFGGEIFDGKLYGRGSTDMKGGIAAAVCGVAAAARNGKLKQRIAVSASVLEEVIEGHALASVLDVCSPKAVIICEPSKLHIKAGQKGRIEIILTLKGKPAHAASPEFGINPLYGVAHALLALKELELPQHNVLGDALLVPTDIISHPYPSISMIPTFAKIRFDRRTLPGETSEEILNEMDRCLKAGGLNDFELQVTDDVVSTYTGEQAAPLRWLPAWQAEKDSKLLESAIEAVQGAGIAPSVSTWHFCTNGSESAGRRQIPTIGLGPGREEDAHTIDESIELSQLIAAKAIYQKLALIRAS